jgi:hypothetical protein
VVRVAPAAYPDPALLISLPLLGRCVPEALFTCTAFSLTRTGGATRPRQRRPPASGVREDMFWCTPERAAAELGVGLLSADGWQGPHVPGSCRPPEPVEWLVSVNQWNRRSGTAAAIAAMPASLGCRWSPLS